MKNKLSLITTLGIATMCVASSGLANERSFKIGGDVELDLTGTEEDSSTFQHGGRILLNVVGKVSDANGYFVQGVAQPLVLFNPGTTALATQDDDLFVNNDALAVDDAYLKIGKEGSWDIQMGRFEAIDLLPLGKDTVAANVDGIIVYSANNVRGRRDDAFHAALHVGSPDKLFFELGVQTSKDDDESILEARPAITYQLNDTIKFRAGYEEIEDDQSGFAIGTSIKLGGGDLNLSLAYAEDFLNPNVTDGRLDVLTVAINYTKGNWGIGYLHAQADISDEIDGIGSKPEINTIYGAYTVPLFGIKDASVTFAGSYSDALDIDDGKGNLSDDDLLAARIRFNYTF